MRQLHEDLRSGDLKDLVNKVFHVDSYKATMGADEKVCVVSFEVIGKDAADDLANFIENGYDFIMDATPSEGESEKRTYTVFVEIQRDRKIANNIEDMIYGIGELAKVTDWRFRYYKDIESKPVEDLKHVIPTDPEKYKAKIENIFEDDMKFFFRKSPLDYIDIQENHLTFKRFYNSPVRLELKDYGTRTDILGNLTATIRIDETSTSESMWLTKYFGDYNITKYDDYFVFEDGNNVLVLKLIS
jgi:hypothetical protein